jgi:NAD(P)-dependent dehydrogenase (short-subunit alcohol dehydrogenase family)
MNIGAPSDTITWRRQVISLVYRFYRRGNVNNEKGILRDKVALITGAASGIGRAGAQVFAREGAKLVLADINEKDGEEISSRVKENGGESVFVKCDVSSTSAVAGLISKAVDVFGRLDCAFNNAGIAGEQAPTCQCSDDNWDLVISVNLKGVWLCMKHEIMQMLKQGKGAIVNTSSIGGLVGLRGFPAYAASKGGIVQLTRTAAVEYARLGIRVNAVCPGWIDTPMLYAGGELNQDELASAMTPEFASLLTAIIGTNPTRAQLVTIIASITTPMVRLGSAQEVAEIAAWLCSDVASYVTGQCLAVDGGLTAQ